MVYSSLYKGYNSKLIQYTLIARMEEKYGCFEQFSTEIEEGVDRELGSGEYRDTSLGNQGQIGTDTLATGAVHLGTITN